jgi:hypothetical protein
MLVNVSHLACGGGSTDDAGWPEGGSPTMDADASLPARDAGMVTMDGGATVMPPDGSLPPITPDGGACGYEDAGVSVHVATDVDVCLPPVVCDPETCPPGEGTCVGGKCVFAAGYHGIATQPEAWVTYYCDLTTGGCHGVTQLEFPEVTAQKVATAMGLPVCDAAPAGAASCVGISAAPPMIVGNSQNAVDPATGQPVQPWGLGLTEASGLCYELTGPGGRALVALTDRCGGYCTCNGSAEQECGACVNASDMKPNCPCVGSAPPLYGGCCGATCGGTVVASCDWCASNNHPHFDLDVATFNRLCGAEATQGSCRLSGVGFVHCLDASGWPPP